MNIFIKWFHVVTNRFDWGLYLVSSETESKLTVIWCLGIKLGGTLECRTRPQTFQLLESEAKRKEKDAGQKKQNKRKQQQRPGRLRGRCKWRWITQSIGSDCRFEKIIQKSEPTCGTWNDPRCAWTDFLFYWAGPPDHGPASSPPSSPHYIYSGNRRNAIVSLLASNHLGPPEGGDASTCIEFCRVFIFIEAGSPKSTDRAGEMTENRKKKEK